MGLQCPHFHQNIIQQYKINNQIKSPELRIIDEAGNNLGVMPLEAALKLSIEKGLDLIEIAAAVKPPVAKIISYDKFRYQKEKEFRKQKAIQKTGEFKQIRISVRAAKNDLEIKVKKIEEFLNDGHKIEIVLALRGREKYLKDWARQKMDEFLKMIGAEYKIIIEPKFGGKGLITQITKK